MVIVVDDDVDVSDYDNVWWALTFRTSMVPEKMNIHFVEGLQAVKLDYSALPSFSSKRTPSLWGDAANGLFIDATRPFIPFPGISLPPAKYLIKARDQWSQYNLPALERKDLPKASSLEQEHLKQGIVVFPDVEIKP